jgi:hypothetical protein
MYLARSLLHSCCKMLLVQLKYLNKIFGENMPSAKNMQGKTLTSGTKGLKSLYPLRLL